MSRAMNKIMRVTMFTLNLEAFDKGRAACHC